MGRYADLRRDYLRERRPQLYKELRQAGLLESHCREREDEARERKRSLMESGAMSDNQAEELIRADLLDQ